MAAGKFHWASKGLEKVANGAIDLDTSGFTAMLVLAAHTPSQDAHDVVNDIVANECADGDYARQAIATPTVNLTTGEVRWDFVDVDFGNTVSITAKYLYIYKNNASDTDHALIGFLDLNTAGTGDSVTSTSSDFDIQLNAAGALKITRTAYAAGN